MIKPMNFNFVGKLPLLLAKKNFTTIRKAEDNSCINCKHFKSFREEYDNDIQEPEDIGRCNHKSNFDKDVNATDEHICSYWEKQREIKKEPNWKEGDLIPVVWTGSLTHLNVARMKLEQEVRPFRELGNVKITKVEEIEVSRWDGGWSIIPYNGYNYCATEGFKDPEEMFKYLEEYLGDLTEPKKAYLYHCTHTY